MFKVIGFTKEEFADLVQNYTDPLIVDICKEQDRQLRRIFKGDYKWIKELTNRGITKIILMSSDSGKMRMRAIFKKAKTFKREVIILYDNAEHYKEVKRLIGNGK